MVGFMKAPMDAALAPGLTRKKRRKPITDQLPFLVLQLKLFVFSPHTWKSLGLWHQSLRTAKFSTFSELISKALVALIVAHPVHVRKWTFMH